MNNKFTIILLILCVCVVAFGAFFLGRYAPKLNFWTKSPEQSQPKIIASQETPVFVDSLQSGTFSQNTAQAPVDISIERARKETTVQVLWDDSQLRVYYVAVLDVEKMALQDPDVLVWAISSLRGVSFPASGVVTQEDVKGFIPSGYMLGASIPEFSVSPEPTTGTLALGKKYYIQLNGFSKDNSMVTVNKEFTFTSSCAAPDCK